jgi:phosphodiesterase/alkaline phosphatase D-like protein
MSLERRAAIVMGAGVACSACLVATIAGCASPTKPSVSVASGRPVSPTTGTQFSYYSQPITLVVANGVVTGGASLVTAVEVATDAAFTSVVTTRTVSPGTNGQPTITLDHLSPATTYYWRVKTTAADNPGVYSSPASFSIGPQLVIQPPAPVQPLAGSFQHKRPTFTVMNATHTGPDATLTYRFDIATDSAFTNVVTSGTASEGSQQTSFTPAVDLTSGATYYWRAQASDTMKGVAGGRSAPQVFTTVKPDDCTFRYDLTLHIDSLTSCVDGYGRPVSPGNPAPFQSVMRIWPSAATAYCMSCQTGMDLLLLS